jgi:SynChlorMet cassette protein ScmC
MRAELRHHLALADGTGWVIAAGDDHAASIVSQLGTAMQLRVMSPSAWRHLVTRPHHGKVRRLRVLIDADNPRAPLATCHPPLPLGGDGDVVCVLRAIPDNDGLSIQLMALSLILAHDAQIRGGVLLHGALAEEDGAGVILAAPGGTGKTTASDRLVAPWRSLCDDATMVVRGADGSYLAHPWPTWSRFRDGASGGTWDVQQAVPLKGVFFLSQAATNRVESVGHGHAVSLLVACAEQTTQLMTRGLTSQDIRALHLQRFSNLCALALGVPTHVLHVSLTGAFWHEIEQALEGHHHMREPVAEVQVGDGVVSQQC